MNPRLSAVVRLVLLTTLIVGAMLWLYSCGSSTPPVAPRAGFFYVWDVRGRCLELQAQHRHYQITTNVTAELMPPAICQQAATDGR